MFDLLLSSFCGLVLGSFLFFGFIIVPAAFYLHTKAKDWFGIYTDESEKNNDS